MRRSIIKISMVFVLNLSLMVPLLWFLVWQLAPGIHAQGGDGFSTYYVAPSCSGAPAPCYTSVQAAVDAIDDPNDVIKMAAGTYTGINTYGELAQVVYVTKSLTIRGGYTPTHWDTPEPDTNHTELNAQTLGRVMVISGTVEVTVEGLHLIYGNATGLKGHPGDPFEDKDAGGSMYVNGATVHLSRTEVMSNVISSSSSLGGGIYMRYGLVTISNCTIQGNSSGHGGALYFVHTEATLGQNTIQSNTGTSGISEGATVHIRSSSDVTLANNTIQNNTRAGSLGFGSIYIKGSQAVFTENLITNNKGAGIYTEFGGAITLTNNLIQGHNDTGVFVYGADSVLVNNTIDGNHLGVHIDQSGGQVSTWLEGNLIQNNQNTSFSAQGGGVYLQSRGAPLTLTHNIIQDNISGLDPVAPHGNGGGVYIAGNHVTLQGNTIRRNQANEFCHPITGCQNQGRGGGIYVSSSADDALLLNNIVTGNQAEGKGSGICIVGSSPTLYHNTIANNNGPADPEAIGVYALSASSGEVAQPKLYNTIIAGQATGIEVNGGALNVAVIDGMLWWGNTHDTGGAGTFLTTHVVPGDPAFADPGSSDYHLVGPASAAIDAGIDQGIATDIDDQSRPHYNGYDLGADEWWSLAAVEIASPDTVRPGDVVTYTLILTNTTDAGMSVRLTDTLPNYVNYLGPLDYNNGHGSYISGEVLWTGPVFTSTPTFISFPIQIVPDAPDTTIKSSVVISDAYGWFQVDSVPISIKSGSRNIYLPVILRQSL